MVQQCLRDDRLSSLRFNENIPGLSPSSHCSYYVLLFQIWSDSSFRQWSSLFARVWANCSLVWFGNNANFHFAIIFLIAIVFLAGDIYDSKNLQKRAQRPIHQTTIYG